MTENTIVQQEIRPKLKLVEVDDIPPAILGPRNGIYDEAITAVLNATKDTISIQIEDKPAKQVYAGLHSRILDYNEKPERKCDLMLAQRQDMTYIKRFAKDSMPKKKAK